MVAPKPLAARRRTNSSSFSVAVPSSWEALVVSGAIPTRFAISCPLLNLNGDQTTIDQTSDILKLDGIERTRSLRANRIHPRIKSGGRLSLENALTFRFDAFSSREPL